MDLFDFLYAAYIQFFLYNPSKEIMPEGKF